MILRNTVIQLWKPNFSISVLGTGLPCDWGSPRRAHEHHCVGMYRVWSCVGLLRSRSSSYPCLIWLIYFLSGRFHSIVCKIRVLLVADFVG